MCLIPVGDFNPEINKPRAIRLKTPTKDQHVIKSMNIHRIKI